MSKKLLAMVILAAIVASGCELKTAPTLQLDTSSVQSESVFAETADTSYQNSYQQISQDEAAKIMREDETAIILDVRTQEEFAEGHIPGAICIPNEEIGTDEITLLPDKQQTILVYCRSGRRSKEASEKLSALGYTNIKEFGGIIDWTGEVVSDDDEIEAAEDISADYADNLPEISDYDEYIADDSEYSLDIMFTANNTVTELKLVSLNMVDVKQNGDPVFNMNDIYEYGELKKGKSLMIRLSFPGDMPNYGISYIDKSGARKYYAIQQSGMDGSLIMWEFQP